MSRARSFVLPVFVALLGACTPEDDTDPALQDTDDTDAVDTDVEAEPMTIASGADGGLAVDLLADAPLQVGWNAVYFRLTDEASSERVTAATIAQAPLMQMTDMAHATPYTDPGAADARGLFAGELVLIMASGMSGSWSDTVTVHTTDAGTDHVVVFPELAVAETNLKKDLTVGDQKWIVTMTPLVDVAVGEVPFVITVHRKESMMSFPPVEGLTLTVSPLMTDMGHGSEGNVDPVYVENGRYEGVVAFSMGGGWAVTIGLRDGDTDVGSVVFDFDV